MLYYDNKISSLENLAKELKSTLETIQTKLSDGAIKNTLQDSFNDLKEETLQSLLESATQKQNVLLGLIETKKAELETHTKAEVESFLSNDKIADLLDLQAISDKLTQNIEATKAEVLSAHAKETLENIATK